MGITFSQQQELETLLQEFKKENRLYGTIQITMNNDTTLFKTTKGVDGDTYEDIAYQRGYVAAVDDCNIKLLEAGAKSADAEKASFERGYKEGYDDGYSEGYEEGYDSGYFTVCNEGE